MVDGSQCRHGTAAEPPCPALHGQFPIAYSGRDRRAVLLLTRASRPTHFGAARVCDRKSSAVTEANNPSFPGTGRGKRKEFVRDERGNELEKRPCISVPTTPSIGKIGRAHV